MRNFLGLALIAFLLFGCSENDGTNDSKQDTINKDLLGYWEILSVSANEQGLQHDLGNWLFLKVHITEDEITTSGIPQELRPVWPTGDYNIIKEGKAILREDGIEMEFIKFGQGVDTYIISFTIPSGTMSLINNIPLDNFYTFGLKRRTYINPDEDLGVYYRFNDFVIKFFHDKRSGAPGYPLEDCFEVIEIPFCSVVRSKTGDTPSNLYFETGCKQSPTTYADSFNRRAIYELNDTITGEMQKSNLLIKIQYP